jgi:hypothetical protein
MTIVECRRVVSVVAGSARTKGAVRGKDHGWLRWPVSGSGSFAGQKPFTVVPTRIIGRRSPVNFRKQKRAV